ncbi:DNA excision repair protein ERCC-5 homolog [Aulostomus maculatus]
MGVHGLWRLLESTGKPVNPETLEGKVLAVDISIWLNQAVKGVRDREGNSVQNAHLLTLFHRICKLLFFRIRPVFVFDGDAPLLKKQTLALRRKRREELNQESRQTNEKLLKTFLKRQAVKAALGDRSKDPLPSLSSVRRNEVDDMYILPALPPAEEKDRSSSEEEEEEEESEDVADMYQGDDMYEDPNSVDINSEEFASLPPEMKHEILKDMKEFSKRRRTMYHKPPERSGDFSQYQLAGLLHRNQLNQRLEGVEKEMNQRSAGGAPQLYQQDGDQQSHDVESRRLVSEDNSHYILIKGSTKAKNPSENQPAAATWAGSSLSGCKKRAVDRPEPLWRPVCEEEAEEQGSSSDDCKPSLPTQGDKSPPSPCTLKAIQAAMNDGSDEEALERVEKDGGVSPRTLLAIQQVLTEEEENAAVRRAHSPVKTQVVISSSEDEREAAVLSNADDLSKERTKENRTRQSLHDSLFVITSEEEMEDVIGLRNQAFHSAVPQHTLEGSEREKKADNKREAEMLQRKDELEDVLMEERTSDNGSVPEMERHQTPKLCVTTLTETEARRLLPESVTLQEIKRDHVKPKSSEESESEESFIEVSEEELEEEDTGDGMKQEEKVEESLTEAPGCPESSLNFEEEEDNEEEAEEKELEEGTETQPSTNQAINEWEHLDMEELEALESSLREEQSSLTGQKQQQERMANTVTGQMYLESQELLQLFGVPFLVAPMEAEAQCAALDRADQTNGTITDDSDVWLFGGRHVFKNFFSQNKYVEHYQYSDLQNQLGLDRTKLINLAYLLGSDYTEGVPGVGYVTGMEILNEFPGPGMEPLKQFSKWWIEVQEKKRLVGDPKETKVKKKLRELKLQPGFPNPAVAQAYLQPAVDQSDSSFSWGRPQLDMIKEYPFSRFGWNSRRTEETLQPVIKQLNLQQTQLRIDSFFRMEQHEKQAIQSQRLRRAITCMKRKEREEGEDEEDTEEETVSPSKSKKGKTADQSQRKAENGQEMDDDRTVVRATGGGGFLGSEVIVDPPLPPLKSVNGSSQESLSVKTLPQEPMTEPQRVRQNNSSSSSEDSDGTYDVAMVTARSVFESSRKGRSSKSTRGRGKARGKKKLICKT